MTRIPRNEGIHLQLRFCSLILFATLPGIATIPATAQANWSGQVQCQLDDVDQTYSRHEIQTWTLASGGPISATGMPAYEATWSATGQGALQRVQGGQTTNIQWTTNVPPTRATIAIFVRGSDNRLIIKPWHSQERVDYALNGMRQIVINGAAQQPSNFSKSVWEWQFPRIEDSPTNTNVSGSTQSQAESGDAELLHHYGGTPPSAVCRWQFTKGGMSPTNSNLAGSNQTGMNGGQPNQNPQGSMAGNTNYQSNGQSCQSPAAVQQSFENMKSNLQSQYTRLIQGSSDPTQVAALTSQEQRMLASMNAQEQHDVTTASQSCLPASSQSGNSYTGGSSNPGGAGNPGAGSAGAGGGNPYAGGGAPNAGGSNAGGAAAAGAASAGAGSNPSASGAGQTAVGSNGGGAATSGTAGSANAGSNSTPGGAGPNGSSGSTNQAATPQLLSLTPTSVSQGSTIQVNLVGQGTHWSNATNVSFGPQVTLQSFTANPSGTSAVATISVASNASPGSRPVMLMSGTEMVGLSSGLTVTAASTQQAGSGTSSSPMRINTGSGFASNSVVLPGMLTGVSPATNNGQQDVTVTLTGQRTNFANGATTVSFVRASQPGSTTALPANSFIAGLNHTISTPPPVQVGPVNVSSATSATVPLTMNPTAAAGTYNITVTTPTSSGTETLTLNNAFTVTTPTLSSAPLNPGAGIVKNPDTTTTPAAPTSATYRVTMTGLMCLRAITGGGDAIYGAAVIRQYDRHSGQSTMSTNANTWVYGDTNGYIGQRIQAGTRGPMGGVGTGDFVPTGFIVGPKDALPPQSNLFPMTLWQGTLTDGVDALVISPSLWIQYGDRPVFSTWNQNEDSLTNSIFLDNRVQNQINTQTFGTLSLGASENVGGSQAQAAIHDAAQAVIDTVLVIPFVNLNGLTHDRPIGLTDASSDPTSSTILPNATPVLTREMIEKHLGTNTWTVTALDFKDSAAGFSNLLGGDRPGEYQMFIQIERQ